MVSDKCPIQSTDLSGQEVFSTRKPEVRKDFKASMFQCQCRRCSNVVKSPEFQSLAAHLVRRFRQRIQQGSSISPENLCHRLLTASHECTKPQIYLEQPLGKNLLNHTLLASTARFGCNWTFYLFKT